MEYSIKMGGKYLAGIRRTRPDPLRIRKKAQARPEWVTAWGRDPVPYEFQTALNFLRVLLDEIRAGEIKTGDITLEAYRGEG